MQFTPNQVEILLHRLEGGTIPEVMEDSDIMSSEVAEELVAEIIVELGRCGEIACTATACMEILKDAADGSTYFAGANEAVSQGQLTRQKLAALHRAADDLEKLLSVKVPRA